MDDRVVEVLKYIAVPLTQGQFAIIDIDDYERVSQYKWYAYYDKTTNSFYARRRKTKKNGHINMSNFILDYYYANGVSIDHKNRETLDNSRENIALRTATQQMINQKKRKDSKRHDLSRGITYRDHGNYARYIVDMRAGSNNIYKSFYVKKDGDIKQADEQAKQLAIMYREKMIMKLKDYRIALNIRPKTLSDLLIIYGNDQ